ncbi:M1 family metallopeptidase [Desulfosarcina sp.]|nr:M1 family metallopeptidase [Desulfosarcina sp.]
MYYPILYYISRWKYLIVVSFLTVSFLPSLSQTPEFTKQDTLRGTITPERLWWDLTYYHLDVVPNAADSSLKGSVLVQYTVLEENQLMQIDLQEPLKITQVEQSSKSLEFNRLGNVYYIQLNEEQKIGESYQVHIFYEGYPRISYYPPWDGGVAWRTDENGNSFIATACQGAGASLWWPCKDHMYDEPDSMLISITAPKDLTALGNGRLRKVAKNKKDKTQTFHWFVSNPINNYGVNMNIGDYVNFSEVYVGEKGDLDCDYYVLSYNLEKAKEHFKQVPMMLEAFEYWFGPYPFYEDSYKLVEVPYPGMEHQSSVTYGNGYKNGFGGRDLSYSGWGEKFDFIIIHESGHEWFANNITYKDVADMWIHESFIAYSESLFTEYFYGKEAGYEYVRGTRANISNDKPIIGKYDVNHEGSGDMYPKGANMLHTLRQLVNNDSTWRVLLRGLNSEFYHQTVTTKQIEDYISAFTGLELITFFDQYLRDYRIPILEYELRDKRLKYRWKNCILEFDMPLKVYLDSKEKWISPTNRWQWLKLEEDVISLKVDKNFYVAKLGLQGE